FLLITIENDRSNRVLFESQGCSRGHRFLSKPRLLAAWTAFRTGPERSGAAAAAEKRVVYKIAESGPRRGSSRRRTRRASIRIERPREAASPRATGRCPRKTRPWPVRTRRMWTLQPVLLFQGARQRQPSVRRVRERGRRSSNEHFRKWKAEQDRRRRSMPSSPCSIAAARR